MALRGIMTQGELLEAYYIQEQVVRNAERTLYNEQLKLEKIRRLILPEAPSPETLNKKDTN